VVSEIVQLKVGKLSEMCFAMRFGGGECLQIFASPKLKQGTRVSFRTRAAAQLSEEGFFSLDAFAFTRVLEVVRVRGGGKD
jgi:hypothetical protein